MSHHKPSKKVQMMQANHPRKRGNQAVGGSQATAVADRVASVSASSVHAGSTTNPPARRLTRISVGFTDKATLLGGAASTVLAAATLVPALPAAVLAAAAAGSVAAFIIGRLLEVRAAAQEGIGTPATEASQAS